MARKKAPEPTFEERLNSARATAEAATSVFANIAADLENAAVEKLAVVSDINTEITRLDDLIGDLELLAVEAEDAAAAALVQAKSIRALAGN